MAKRKKTDSYKVYAFMINAATFIVVSQDGQKAAQIKVENDYEAKTLLIDEELINIVVGELKRQDFTMLWIDDPAGDPEVVEACKKMEQKHTDEMLSDAIGGDASKTEEGKPVELDLAIPAENKNDDSIAIKSIIDKDRCEAKIGGVWKPISVPCLCIGDIFRIFTEAGTPVFGNASSSGKYDKEFQVVEKPTPDTDAEGEVNYTIQARIYNENTAAEIKPEVEAVEPAKPNFKAAPKTKTVDIECPETYSEQKIKRLIREMQNLENERLTAAQEFNEQIKVAKKALYAAIDGKSFIPMECLLVEDWENGERRYIRPDNGQVALLEKIPYEERQLKMDLQILEPGSEVAEKLVDAEAQEQVVDESALSADVVNECATDGEGSAEAEAEKCTFGIVFGSDECKSNGCTSELQERCSTEFEEKTNENDFPPPDQEEQKPEDSDNFLDSEPF